jgi:formylglycine-generating enzyme required for sulfatase activity
VPAELADLLDRCTDHDLRHRLQNFDDVLQELARLEGKRTAEEESRREEERRQEAERERLVHEDADRRQQELLRLQQEGETKLGNFVLQVLQRTEGHPSSEDTAEANRIGKEHRLNRESAQAVVDRTRTQWQADRERQRREEEHKRREEEERQRLEEERREMQRRDEKKRPESLVKEPQPGEVFTNSLGMKFAWIPPGTFMMGSPPGEGGRSDDEVQHRVRLTRGFWLGYTL